MNFRLKKLFKQGLIFNAVLSYSNQFNIQQLSYDVEFRSLSDPNTKPTFKMKAIKQSLST